MGLDQEKQFLTPGGRFRLYDPPLREIAPRHLRAYAQAAQEINQLIAGVVA
jgi:hypothetical protein